MEPELKAVEVERAVSRDNDFAVEHAALGQLFQERAGQFREVAVQRLLLAALYEDFAGLAEDQRAESIPFGFEDPVAFGGEGIHAFREHWKDGRVDGKVHLI